MDRLVDDRISLGDLHYYRISTPEGELVYHVLADVPTKILTKLESQGSNFLIPWASTPIVAAQLWARKFAKSLGDVETLDALVFYNVDNTTTRITLYRRVEWDDKPGSSSFEQWYNNRSKCE